MKLEAHCPLRWAAKHRIPHIIKWRNYPNLSLSLNVWLAPTWQNRTEFHEFWFSKSKIESHPTRKTSYAFPQIHCLKPPETSLSSARREPPTIHRISDSTPQISTHFPKKPLPFFSISPQCSTLGRGAKPPSEPLTPPSTTTTPPPKKKLWSSERTDAATEAFPDPTLTD